MKRAGELTALIAWMNVQANAFNGKTPHAATYRAVVAALQELAELRALVQPLVGYLHFPVRWDDEDLLGADNRIIVWGKCDADDKDDVNYRLGRVVEKLLNRLVPSGEDHAS
jgi:hypothetical protein